MRPSFATINHSPFFGAQSPLPEVIAAAGGAGFDLIGLDIWSVDRFVAEGGSIGDVDAMVADAGLAVSDVLPLVIGGDVREIGDAARHLNALVARTGATACVVACTAEAELSSAATRRAIEEAIGIVGDAGARAAFEWVSYSALSTVAATIALVDDIGWERAGLCVDSWHTFTADQSLKALPTGSVVMVQINDGRLPLLADPVTAGRHHRLVPGTGDFDLAGFVADVQEAGFDGIVSAEVLSDEVRAGGPERFARRIKPAIERSWARSGLV